MADSKPHDTDQSHVCNGACENAEGRAIRKTKAWKDSQRQGRRAARNEGKRR